MVPTLLGELAAPGADPAAGWFPEPVAGPNQVVLLVIDGLGEEQLRERIALAPVLAGGVGRAHHLGGPEHHGVRPDHPGHGAGCRPSTVSSGTGSPSTAR